MVQEKIRSGLGKMYVLLEGESTSVTLLPSANTA